LGWSAFSTFTATTASAVSLHCTPAPTFPVPLNEGVWRSAEFPVGKHDYHVWLYADRHTSPIELDCDVKQPPGHQCTPTILDLEWKIWNGTVLVKSWPFNPISAEGELQRTTYFLGDFEGKRNGHFTLELNVRKDVGRLKDLNPRIQIVKNPGYWCWL
jgi:hypothetical protein